MPTLKRFSPEGLISQQLTPAMLRGAERAMAALSAVCMQRILACVPPPKLPDAFFSDPEKSHAWQETTDEGGVLHHAVHFDPETRTPQFFSSGDGRARFGYKGGLFFAESHLTKAQIRLRSTPDLSLVEAAHRFLGKQFITTIEEHLTTIDRGPGLFQFTLDLKRGLPSVTLRHNMGEKGIAHHSCFKVLPAEARILHEHQNGTRLVIKPDEVALTALKLWAAFVEICPPPLKTQEL